MADGDDMDISLWRPYGERRVEHILLSDSPQQIRDRGIEYMVVGGAYLAAMKVDLEDWLRQVRGEKIATGSAMVKVSEGLQPWYIVHLKELGPLRTESDTE